MFDKNNLDHIFNAAIQEAADIFNLLQPNIFSFAKFNKQHRRNARKT